MGKGEIEGGRRQREGREGGRERERKKERASVIHARYTHVHVCILTKLKKINRFLSLSLSLNPC